MKLLSPWDEDHTHAKNARLVLVTVLVVDVCPKTILPASAGLLVVAFVSWATRIARTALLVTMSGSSGNA
jgi:hypothetical protein